LKIIEMELHNLPKLKGKRRKAKRVGRGYASGKGGHTVGRGSKGQKARSKVKLGFEGGQLPLHKRLPQKRGFKRAFRDEVEILNVGDLNYWDEKVEINPENLLEAGLIDQIPKGGVKILGDGEIKKKLTVKGVQLSESAKEKIIKAEGKIIQ
jgi:large subunit ribosomal protein L15